MFRQKLLRFRDAGLPLTEADRRGLLAAMDESAAMDAGSGA